MKLLATIIFHGQLPEYSVFLEFLSRKTGLPQSQIIDFRLSGSGDYWPSNKARTVKVFGLSF